MLSTFSLSSIPSPPPPPPPPPPPLIFTLAYHVHRLWNETRLNYSFEQFFLIYCIESDSNVIF